MLGYQRMFCSFLGVGNASEETHFLLFTFRKVKEKNLRLYLPYYKALHIQWVCRTSTEVTLWQHGLMVNRKWIGTSGAAHELLPHRGRGRRTGRELPAHRSRSSHSERESSWKLGQCSTLHDLAEQPIRSLCMINRTEWKQNNHLTIIGSIRVIEIIMHGCH